MLRNYTICVLHVATCNKCSTSTNNAATLVMAPIHGYFFSDLRFAIWGIFQEKIEMKLRSFYLNLCRCSSRLEIKYHIYTGFCEAIFYLKTVFNPDDGWCISFWQYSILVDLSQYQFQTRDLCEVRNLYHTMPLFHQIISSAWWNDKSLASIMYAQRRFKCYQMYIKDLTMFQFFW